MGEVWQVYEALSKVPNGKFTVAAAFGNVHGVYSPGNVRLEPQILHNTQKFISEKLGGDDKKPVYFVFHGGSGSSTEDIQYAIEAGTIKMNIDGRAAGQGHGGPEVRERLIDLY